jgi:hypothetical protein
MAAYHDREIASARSVIDLPNAVRIESLSYDYFSSGCSQLPPEVLANIKGIIRRLVILMS